MPNSQRNLAFAGAILLTIGMFTGLWTAAAMTGSVALKIPRLALAAHLNGLIGGLWMIAVAYTFPFLKYDAKQLKRLMFLVGIPCWANWLLTLIASLMGENGLAYKGTPGADSLAFGLQALVVAPALVGCVYWTRGFCCGSKTAQP